MQLIVLGLNHKTAPVEIREKFNFSRERIKAILRRLRAFEYLNEAVLVSTCNRTELYLVLEKPTEGLEFLKHAVQHLAGTNYRTEYFYNLTGVNCVKHLFKVIASLDSLVIGEGQILSQMKEAYNLARGQGLTSTMMNTLFHRAIAVGKRVRTETKIAYNSVSVSSAAVDMAIEVIGDLHKANILVIGAGHMSELTARHLIDKGASSIFVSNRRREHAEELAEKFHGSVIGFEHFLEHAACTADVVITSTGAPHYIITAEALRKILPCREAGRPLILIDIAVPRDVEPEVGEMAGVTLFNIDDLEEVVDIHRDMRAKEAQMAEVIIAEEVGAVRERLRYLSMRPVMVRLHEKMDLLSERVVKKAFVKLPELTEREKSLIESTCHRLTHKFLREPMIAMNSIAGSPEEETYKNMICELFKLTEAGEDGIGDETKYDYWD